MAYNERAKRGFTDEEIKKPEEDVLEEGLESGKEQPEHISLDAMAELGILYDERNKLEERLNAPAEPESKLEEEGPQGKDEETDKASILDKARGKFKKLFAPAKEESMGSKEAVGEIKRRLGVKTEGAGVMKVNESIRRQLSVEQRAAEVEINKLEKEALDFLDAEADTKNSKEFKPDFSGILKEAGEIGKDMKKAREEFVEKFIEESVEAILKHFRKDFDESENGGNAKGLAELKTEKEIRRAARSFIEGGEPDFGFIATLEISSFEIEGGEKKQYITEYTVEIHGHEEKLRKNNLLFSSQSRALLNEEIKKESTLAKETKE